METEVGGAVGWDSSRCQGQRLSEGVLVLGVQRGVIETRNRISQVFKQFKELKPLKGRRWRGLEAVREGSVGGADGQNHRTAASSSRQTQISASRLERPMKNSWRWSITLSRC